MPQQNRADYIRVSKILYPFSGLQDLDQSIVNHAAERGTRVHKICEAIMLGLGEIGVTEETWGYVESFKKWWGEGKDVREIEKRFWCDDCKITGQVDMIINTPDGLALVDIKTSSRVSKTWKAQGQAYHHLCQKAGINIAQILFLHLNKHGKSPKVIEYQEDIDFFLSVLEVYKHFFHKE